MASYAVVENNIVTNLVEWDGETVWSPVSGDAVLTDGTVGIGWHYADSTFTAPPVPTPSREELVTSAEQTKSVLLDAATAKIVVWQTKLLVGRKLTDNETAQLNSWLDYIDAVTAIDTSIAPNLEWPALPSE